MSRLHIWLRYKIRNYLLQRPFDYITNQEADFNLIVNRVGVLERVCKVKLRLDPGCPESIAEMMGEPEEDIGIAGWELKEEFKIKETTTDE